MCRRRRRINRATRMMRFVPQRILWPYQAHKPFTNTKRNDMTKQELITGIQAEITSNLTQGEIDEVLTALGDLSARALAQGDTVKIPGLLSLKTTDRTERLGRNPQTGAALVIPAKRVVKASVFKSLAEAVAH